MIPIYIRFGNVRSAYAEVENLGEVLVLLYCYCNNKLRAACQ